MHISLLEPIGVSAAQIDELAAPIRAAGHTFTYYDQVSTDAQELIRRSEGCEVVMIANHPYPAQVVRESAALRMIDVAFTGIDHVGLDACRERGITVCNAANYSNQTVAELVIALTLGLLRRVPLADARLRAGGTAAGLTGREIGGKTVGIIGTGRIGLMAARLFQAFGAKVIAYSRSVREEATAMGIEYVSLDTLMRRSDIISVHTPNNASTRGLIGRAQIDQMKPTALLINCARGPIVDSAALAQALNEGRIAGAGVDVYDVEPPIPESEPLLHAKNTLLTPHIAFASEESMIRRAHIVFDNLYAYLKGEPQNVCEL